MKQESAAGRRLDGMKEIADYMRRSESTILKMIRELSFPAVKAGGIWVSHTAKIEAWTAALVDGQISEPSPKRDRGWTDPQRQKKSGQTGKQRS
jgi:hypothetical protein